MPGIDGLPGDQGDKVRNAVVLIYYSRENLDLEMSKCCFHRYVYLINRAKQDWLVIQGDQV